MLEDFKNLLKMSLKILFIKRKRKFPSISSPSSHSAQHQPQPSSPPLFPARPSFAQPSNPTSHAQPSSCACTRTRQPPAQHHAPASRAQPLTARPRPSARPPPLPAPSEPPGHVARPQPPPWRRGSALPRVPRLLFKRSRAPPRVSLSLPAPFSPRSRPQLPHGGALRIAVRRPRRRLPRATVDSILPRCELRLVPLSLPVQLISRFVGRRPCFGCVRELSAAGHGAAAPAFPSGRLLDLSATPFSPRALGCPQFPVWRTLAPLTELAGVLFAAGHG